MDAKCSDYCWCGSKLAYRNGAYVGFWCPAHGPQERVPARADRRHESTHDFYRHRRNHVVQALRPRLPAPY